MVPARPAPRLEKLAARRAAAAPLDLKSVVAIFDVLRFFLFNANAPRIAELSSFHNQRSLGGDRAMRVI